MQRRLLAAAVFPLSMATSDAFAGFDCAKASLPVDFVICAGPRTLQANEAHTAAWQAARAVLDDEGKKSLLTDQRAWIKRYGVECGLPEKGRPTASAIAGAEPCVYQAIIDRTAVLSRVAATRRLTAIGEVTDSVETPNGTLSVVNTGQFSYRVILGSAILHADDGETVSLYQAKPGAPVVMVEIGSGGTACPTTYLLIDVRPQQPFVSKEIGNCALPRVDERNGAFRVVFPAAGQAGSETWEYRPGDLRQVASGEGNQATWQSSHDAVSSGQVALGIRDKWGGLGQYKATFAVKDRNNRRWARTITVDGEEFGYRTFPDDFDAPASGGEYTYEIVVNEAVVAHGSFNLTAVSAAAAQAPSQPVTAAAPARPVAAPVQSAPQPTKSANEFAPVNIATIVETAQVNSARFARDYKGMTLQSQAFFHSLNDGFLGQKQLVAINGNVIIQCLGWSALAKAAVDWNFGEPIVVTGTISDFEDGSLVLKSCTATHQ